MCSNRSDCYLVQLTANGSAALYGGGTAGGLSDGGAVLSDVSQRGVPGLPLPTLLMRLGDPAMAVACLVKADASDLISMNMVRLSVNSFGRRMRCVL
jgi:hypothetical protein